MQVQTFQGLAGNTEIGRLVYSHRSEQQLTEVDQLRSLAWYFSLFWFWWQHRISYDRSGSATRPRARTGGRISATAVA